MPAAAPGSDRWRVGDLLARRRARIDPRYKVREQFVRERGGAKAAKLFYEIERDTRVNFDSHTMAAFTAAYNLPPGWLESALKGDIRPLPSPEDVAVSIDTTLAGILYLIQRADPDEFAAADEQMYLLDAPPEVRKRIRPVWEAIREARARRGGQAGNPETAAGLPSPQYRDPPRPAPGSRPPCR